MRTDRERERVSRAKKDIHLGACSEIRGRQQDCREESGTVSSDDKSGTMEEELYGTLPIGVWSATTRRRLALLGRMLLAWVVVLCVLLGA